MNFVSSEERGDINKPANQSYSAWLLNSWFFHPSVLQQKVFYSRHTLSFLN